MKKRNQLIDDLLSDFNEPLDMSELCAEGFFNNEYLDEELPDSYFEQFDDRFSEDKCVAIVKQPPLVGGIETSRYHFINYETDEIEVGPKNTDPLSYYVEQDLTITEPVIRWCLDEVEGIVQDFPYVPPVDLIVDRNKIKPDLMYTIQSVFMSKGYNLSDPTFSEQKYCSKFGGMVSKVPMFDSVEKY